MDNREIGLKWKSTHSHVMLVSNVEISIVVFEMLQGIGSMEGLLTNGGPWG